MFDLVSQQLHMAPDPQSFEICPLRNIPISAHLSVTTVAISILWTKLQCHHDHSFWWETEAQKGLDNLFKTTHTGLWHFWTVVLGKTLESPLDCKDIQPVHPKGKLVLNIHWKDRCWSSNTLATWWEQLTHWKRPRCWERLKAQEEGERRWDGWIASLIQWT